MPEADEAKEKRSGKKQGKKDPTPDRKEKDKSKCVCSRENSKKEP